MVAPPAGAVEFGFVMASAAGALCSAVAGAAVACAVPGIDGRDAIEASDDELSVGLIELAAIRLMFARARRA